MGKQVGYDHIINLKQLTFPPKRIVLTRLCHRCKAIYSDYELQQKLAPCSLMFRLRSQSIHATKQNRNQPRHDKLCPLVTETHEEEE